MQHAHEGPYLAHVAAGEAQGHGLQEGVRAVLPHQGLHLLGVREVGLDSEAVLLAHL